jgi:signal recognition particle GTPase
MLPYDIIKALIRMERVMNTKIKELNMEELKAFIDETVDKRLEERFGDPDVGLEVKPELIRNIRKSRQSKTNTSVQEVTKRLGLKW